MTYNDVINSHKESLIEKTDKIKSEMDSFIDTIKETDDSVSTFKNFETRFTKEIYSFKSDNLFSYPEIIKDTAYTLFCVKNSIDVSLDLDKYYEQMSNKILCNALPLDCLLEIED